MSKYIKKIEKDYNDGKISKEEATKLKLDYQKNWGGDDIEELENELKGINPKKKSTKLLIFVFTSDFGVVGIPIVIATAFSVISFFLFKEMLLFQVDKNFLLYKQSEKYLK
jgi:hypothetical protein